MLTTVEFIWENKLSGKSPRKEKSTLQIVSIGEKSNEKRNTYRNAAIKEGEVIHIGDAMLSLERKGKEATLHIALQAENSSEEPKTMHFNIGIASGILESCEDITNGRFREVCYNEVNSIDTLHIHTFMSRLLIERIEDKAERIHRTFEQCNKKWDETLFKLLIRNFGFGIQSDIFEEWGEQLDFNALGKHHNSIEQIEAIFFGQAGLLEQASIPEHYRQFALKEAHYNKLVQEYKFLKAKFNLKSTDHNIWNRFSNTPHIRIARLASLYCNNRISVSKIASCETLDELRNLLQIQPEGYWRDHLHFGGTRITGVAPMRNEQINLLIINTIVPILYTYGKHRHDITLCSKAEDFMHNLGSEENGIIRKWRQRGITPTCAADSQALIQLQKGYCDKSNCCNCRIAYELIKNRT